MTDIAAPTGWTDNGLAPTRGILAEAVVAELCWEKQPGTLWKGGRNAGFDVVSDDGRFDAKVVTLDKDGWIVLFRDNARPFNVDKVDFIVLVVLDNSTCRSTVDLEEGTVKFAASASVNSVWNVPVSAMNAAMPKHTANDPKWRKVLINPEVLAEYKVKIGASSAQSTSTN